MVSLEKVTNLASAALLLLPIIAYSGTQVAQAATTDFSDHSGVSSPANSLNAATRDPNSIVGLNVDKQDGTPVLRINITPSDKNVIMRGDKLYVSFDKKNVSLDKSLTFNSQKDSPYTISKDAKNNRLIVKFNKDITSGSYSDAVAIATKNVNAKTQVHASFAGMSLPVSHNGIDSVHHDTQNSSTQATAGTQPGTTQTVAQAANSQQPSVSNNTSYNLADSNSYSTSTAPSYETTTQAANESSNGSTTSTQGTTNVTNASNASNASNDQSQNIKFDDARQAVDDRTTINVAGTSNTSDTTSSNVETPAVSEDNGNITPQATTTDSTTGTTDTSSVATSVTPTNNTVATTPVASQTSTSISSSSPATQTAPVSDSSTSNSDFNAPADAVSTPDANVQDPQTTLDNDLAQSDQNDSSSDQVDTDKVHEGESQFEGIRSDIYGKMPTATETEKAEVVKTMPWIWKYISDNTPENDTVGKVWNFATNLSSGRIAYISINGLADSTSPDQLQKQMPVLLKTFGSSFDANTLDQAVDNYVLKNSQVYKDYVNGSQQNTSNDPNSYYNALNAIMKHTSLSLDAPKVDDSQVIEIHQTTPTDTHAELEAAKATAKANAANGQNAVNGTDTDSQTETEKNKGVTQFDAIKRQLNDKMSFATNDEKTEIVKGFPEALHDISTEDSENDTQGRVWYFKQLTSNGRYIYTTIDGRKISDSIDSYEVNLPQVLRAFGKDLKQGSFDKIVDYENMTSSSEYFNYASQPTAATSAVTGATKAATNGGSGLGILPLLLMPLALPAMLVTAPFALAALPLLPVIIPAIALSIPLLPVIIPAVVGIKLALLPIKLGMLALALPLLPLIIPALPILSALVPVAAIAGVIGLALAPLNLAVLAISTVVSVVSAVVFIGATIANIALIAATVGLTLFNNLVVLPLLLGTMALDLLNTFIILPTLLTLFALSTFNVIVLGGLLVFNAFKNILLFLANLALLPGALLFPPLALLLGALDLFNIFISTPIMLALAGLNLLNLLLLNLAKLPLILGLLLNGLALGLKNLLILPLLGLQVLGLINTLLLLGLIGLIKLGAIALGAINALIAGIATTALVYLVLKTLKDLFNLALLLLGVPLVLLGIPMMLLAPLLGLLKPLILLALPFLMPFLILLLLLPALFIAAIPALLLSLVNFLPLYLINKLLWLLLEPILYIQMLNLPLYIALMAIWLFNLLTWPLSIIPNLLTFGLLTPLTFMIPLWILYAIQALILLRQWVIFLFRFVDFLLPFNLVPFLFTLAESLFRGAIVLFSLATLNPIGGLITLGLVALWKFVKVIQLGFIEGWSLLIGLLLTDAWLVVGVFGFFVGWYISILLPAWAPFLALIPMTLLQGLGLLPAVGLALRIAMWALILAPTFFNVFLPFFLLGGGFLLFNLIRDGLIYLFFSPIIWALLWSGLHFIRHTIFWLIALFTFPLSTILLFLPMQLFALFFTIPHIIEQIIGAAIWVYGIFNFFNRILFLAINPLVWIKAILDTVVDQLLFIGMILSPLAALPVVLSWLWLRTVEIWYLFFHMNFFVLLNAIDYFIFVYLGVIFTALQVGYIANLIPGAGYLIEMFADFLLGFGLSAIWSLFAISAIALTSSLAIPLTLFNSLFKGLFFSFIPFLLGLGMTLLGLAQQLIALVHLLFLDWILPIIPALLLGNGLRLLSLIPNILFNLLLTLIPDLFIWPLIGLNLLKQLIPALLLPLLLGTSLIPMGLKLLGLGLLNLLKLPNILGLLALLPLILFNILVKIPLLTLGTILFALLGLAHILLRLLNHGLQLANLLKQAIELPLLLLNLLKQAILLPLILLTLFNRFINRLVRDALALQHAFNTLLRNLVLIPLALLNAAIALSQILPWILSTLIGIPLSLFNLIKPWLDLAYADLLAPLYVLNAFVLPLLSLLGLASSDKSSNAVNPDLESVGIDPFASVFDPIRKELKVLFDKIDANIALAMNNAASNADFLANDPNRYFGFWVNHNAITDNLGWDAVFGQSGANNDSSDVTAYDPDSMSNVDSNDNDNGNDADADKDVNGQATFPQTGNANEHLGLLGTIMMIFALILAAYRKRRRNKKNGKKASLA